MSFVVGLLVTMGCMLGGFAALGGHIIVLWQPWEFVIIMGSALGTFIVANPVKVIQDTGNSAANYTFNRELARRTVRTDLWTKLRSGLAFPRHGYTRSCGSKVAAIPPQCRPKAPWV